MYFSFPAFLLFWMIERLEKRMVDSVDFFFLRIHTKTGMSKKSRSQYGSANRRFSHSMEFILQAELDDLVPPMFAAPHQAFAWYLLLS